MSLFKLSPRNWRQLRKILPFGVIWTVGGWIFLYVEYAATDELKNTPEAAVTVNAQVLVFASIATFIVGMLVGLIETVFLERRFADRSFLQKIFFKLFVYAGFFLTIVIITFPFAASLDLGLPVNDPQVIDKFKLFLFSETHLSTFLQMTVSTGACLFYSEISDNIGQRALLNFFTGKYHQPKLEERIFMFLDMKSSTTIAESLGDQRYFKLLRKYYDVLSVAIIESGGQVYQYVGDEIIISWELRSKDPIRLCLQCFYMMQENLTAHSDEFLQEYGLVPEFKAGIHGGEVMTGEIGVIKKEIFFTGDVLNTTARIQSLCNEYEERLLVSNYIVELSKDLPEFSFKSHGSTQLRGRKEPIEIFSINPPG
jgi:adenylate cyclase